MTAVLTATADVATIRRAAYCEQYSMHPPHRSHPHATTPCCRPGAAHWTLPAGALSTLRAGDMPTARILHQCSEGVGQYLAGVAPNTPAAGAHTGTNTGGCQPLCSQPDAPNCKSLLGLLHGAEPNTPGACAHRTLLHYVHYVHSWYKAQGAFNSCSN